MNAIELIGGGAVYIRISEDDQEADRQRKSTAEWIERQGVDPKKVAIYDDLGWKRHQADHRPKFQKMLRDADDGRIKWIVCDALDRFGTKNKNQLLAFLYRLQEAGCKLYTVNDKEWTGTDLLTLIEAGMEGEKSERELRDKSERVLEAMRVMAAKGTWLGGRIPYGCDVVAFRTVGTKLVEQWRVTIVGAQSRLKIDSSGKERVYDGKNNFPASENDEILQLRPTRDDARLNVIRTIFHRFATENINFNQLATQLDAQKVPPPPYAKGWQYFHLRDLLVNPVYVGKPGWNRRTHGQYTQWKDGKRQSKKPGGGKVPHEKVDWITPEEPIFAPIVNPKLFAKVQAKMASLPAKKRSPKSAAMWLSGLVYCSNCGKAMCGKKDGRTGKPHYICSTYVNAIGPRRECGCLCNIVSHERIEEKLRDYLSQAGLELADMISGVKKAVIGKPLAIREAFDRTVESFHKMMGLVEARHVELGVGFGSKPRTALELPDLRTSDGVIFVPPNETDRLEAMYRNKFEDGSVDWENKLDELQAKQETLFERLDKIPVTSTDALSRVQSQLDQVDAEIRDTKTKLENAADAFHKANDEYDRLNREWAEAQSVVETETSARRKSEAIRKVISRINLLFRPTGKKRPVSELLALEWVPVGSVNPQSPAEWKSALEQMSLNSAQGSGCLSPLLRASDLTLPAPTSASSGQP